MLHRSILTRSLIVVWAAVAGTAVVAPGAHGFAAGEGVDDKIWTAGLAVDAPIEGIIVKFRAGTRAAAGDLGQAQTILPDVVKLARSGADDIALTAVHPMANQRVLVATAPAMPTRDELLTVMRSIAVSDDVEMVEPNLRVTYPLAVVNDPDYPRQWHYSEGWAGAAIPRAWDQNAFGSGVTVAVLDTGITDHPDLDAQTTRGYDFITSPATARDGGGRDGDPHDQGDWFAANECKASMPGHDSSWHGTHVSGTIAAQTNNNIGGTGVAPGARIQTVRVIGRCGGTFADISDGIAWAAGALIRGVPRNQTPAQVINASLGGTSPCPPMYEDALNFAYLTGATVVIAAGNENQNVAQATPANCAAPHITVAALGREGHKAVYSNFGSLIDVAAPGGDKSTGTANGVYSTLNAGTTVPGAPSYGYLQGTSMAAPHVAGIAALMIGVSPNLPPEEIEMILKSTSRPIPGLCLFGCGAGLVHAGNAVSTARRTAG